MQTVKRLKNAVTNAAGGNNRNTANVGNNVQQGSKYNFLTYMIFIFVLSKNRMLRMLFVNYAGNNASSVNTRNEAIQGARNEAVQGAASDLKKNGIFFGVEVEWDLCNILNFVSC